MRGLLTSHGCVVDGGLLEVVNYSKRRYFGTGYTANLWPRSLELLRTAQDSSAKSLRSTTATYLSGTTVSEEGIALLRGEFPTLCADLFAFAPTVSDVCRLLSRS